MVNQSLKTLGKRIKKLRKSKQMDQVDLSAATGLSRSYIGSIEQGRRNPSLKTLDRIARVLGIRTKDLL